MPSEPAVKLKHGDFWDHVLDVIIEANAECSKMCAAGTLGDFEKAWLDPIERLSECSWFTHARPRAKRFAEASIRSEVKRMIEYYRYVEKLLGSERG
jgi:hypothetical protein